MHTSATSPDPHDPDLPGIEAPRRPSYRRIGYLVGVAVLAAAVGLALTRSYLPWLLIALLVVIWLRRA